MIAYVDSSVLLRVALGDSNALDSWSSIERAVSSEIARIECLRAIDRARIRARLDDAVVAERRTLVLELLDAIEVVPLSPAILARAADPFPTLLATLDAIHLASALAARTELPDLVLATHDVELGRAASSMGFEVAGLP